MPLNLVQHRAEPNVWDQIDVRRDWDLERWLTAVAAGVFLASGLRRRGPAGLLLALGGSSLAWWASAGVDTRNQRRGQLRAALPRRRAANADPIGETSEQSFPASDAPSWTPTTGNTGPAGKQTPHPH